MVKSFGFITGPAWGLTMDELLEDFLAETREMLEALGGELVAWEEAPGDRARLDSRAEPERRLALPRMRGLWPWRHMPNLLADTDVYQDLRWTSAIGRQ